MTEYDRRAVLESYARVQSHSRASRSLQVSRHIERALMSAGADQSNAKAAAGALGDLSMWMELVSGAIDLLVAADPSESANPDPEMDRDSVEWALRELSADLRGFIIDAVRVARHTPRVGRALSSWETPADRAESMRGARDWFAPVDDADLGRLVVDLQDQVDRLVELLHPGLFVEIEGAPRPTRPERRLLKRTMERVHSLTGQLRVKGA
ncbi:MAG: hypothetical protein R3C39_04040 [Dehalococcoidia bacterium]